MTEPSGGEAATGVPPTCYRHPDRETWIRCQRCDRPICPDCMRDAAVGFHCPQCARQGRQQVHTRHTLARSRDPIVTKALIGINLAVLTRMFGVIYRLSQTCLNIRL